jgi:hypothetical protein
MESADNPAFEDRPETFNRVGMDCASDVLAPGVIDDTMREFFAERPVTTPSVGAYQTYLFGNSAAHKSCKRSRINAVDDASDDLALALNGANNWGLARADTASAPAAALVLMPVLSEAANKSLIDFDDTCAFRSNVITDSGRR